MSIFSVTTFSDPLILSHSSISFWIDSHISERLQKQLLTTIATAGKRIRFKFLCLSLFTMFFAWLGWDNAFFYFKSVIGSKSNKAIQSVPHQYRTCWRLACTHFVPPLCTWILFCAKYYVFVQVNIFKSLHLFSRGDCCRGSDCSTLSEFSFNWNVQKKEKLHHGNLLLSLLTRNARIVIQRLCEKLNFAHYRNLQTRNSFLETKLMCASRIH